MERSLALFALIATLNGCASGTDAPPADNEEHYSDDRADGAGRSVTRFGLLMRDIDRCESTYAQHEDQLVTCLVKANEATASYIDVHIGAVEGLHWDDIEPTRNVMRRIVAATESGDGVENARRMMDAIVRFSAMPESMDDALDTYETPYAMLIETVAPACESQWQSERAHATTDAEGAGADLALAACVRAFDVTDVALQADIDTLCQHFAWSVDANDDVQQAKRGLCIATFAAHAVSDAAR